MSVPEDTRLRVLITRPKADAEALRADVEGLGFDVVVEPLLDIVPVSAALPDLDRVQALVLTSRHAVPALPHQAKQKTIYAVGEATAEAAGASGCLHVMTADGNAHELARLLVERCRPNDGTILHLSGDVTRPGMMETLETHGFDYERVIVYRAVSSDKLSSAIEAEWRAGTIGAVLLFSPRTAEILVRLLCQSGLGSYVDTTAAICLSEAAAAPCKVLKWRSVHVATRPEKQALLKALVGSSTI